MRIPFVDLRTQYLAIKSEIDGAIQSVLRESGFVRSRFVTEFERAFAEEVGVKYCVGVGNGTDALYIALKMMGIGKGDEVITTATTWISTAEIISQTGARPVFVDIDREFFTLDEKLIEEAINSRTRAIVPVHLYGQMAEMDVICRIADDHGLLVLEDCAQSHFSRYHGRNAGTMGNAGAFSFYPGKNLGAYGDAGAIVTDDDELAEACRMFANHGQASKHTHLMEGVNSRLDGLQASVLSVKLRHIHSWNERRRELARNYDSLLRAAHGVICPKVRDDTYHTFHIYGILAEDRDGLRDHLSSRGVSTGIHYPTALPFLSIYEHLAIEADSFPNARAHQERQLSLPMFPEMELAQLRYVADCVLEYLA